MTQQAPQSRQEPADAARGVVLAFPLAIGAPGVGFTSVSGRSPLVEAAREFAQAAKSEATRRAYASDLRDFDSWCASQRRSPMPAEPETVALYITDLARSGRAASTIQRRLAAISQVHQLAGHVPPPTADWEVRQVIQGIRRRIGTAPSQKEAILTVTLRRLVSSCDPATRAGARDRALLLLGFAAGSRRSELVSLDVQDATETAEGLRIRIRRSKTDPEARGDEVGIVRGQHPDIDR